MDANFYLNNLNNWQKVSPNTWSNLIPIGRNSQHIREMIISNIVHQELIQLSQIRDGQFTLHIFVNSRLIDTSILISNKVYTDEGNTLTLSTVDPIRLDIIVDNLISYIDLYNMELKDIKSILLLATCSIKKNHENVKKVSKIL